MPHIRDYFAEMYVAGIFADAGWNVYFPRRDKGFDFIVTIKSSEGMILRPVQVKGLYPTAIKVDKRAYGYIGNLTALHDDMILVLVYFDRGALSGIPVQIAYMPRARISRSTRGYSCQPAKIQSGQISARRDFARYFDVQGLAATTEENWL